MRILPILLLAACSGGAPDVDATTTQAAIQLTSEPAGAAVFIDGKQVGQTPYQLTEPATVELRADLHAAKTVQVSASTSVTLEPGVAQLVGYDGRFRDDPALTPGDVARIPTDKLRTVRNEIFARYGRSFESDDLRKHFESTDWYKPNPKFSDDVLTPHDKANIDLIASFEGKAADPLKKGEYSGDPGLMFVDAQTVELLTGDDMYEWMRESRHWAAMGDWIVTWEGADAWSPTDPKVKDARLWKLDHKKGAVLESTSLGATQG